MTAGGSGDGFGGDFVWGFLGWDDLRCCFVVGVGVDLDLCCVLDKGD